MEPAYYLHMGLIFFLAGAVIPLVPLRTGKSSLFLLPAIGSLGFAVSGLYGCFTPPGYGGTDMLLLSNSSNSLFASGFRPDALSGFFVFLISILAFPVSLYSIGYAKSLQRNGLMGSLFSLFILSMYGVVLSGNIITFLVSWETMSVTSCFLAAFDRDDRAAKTGLTSFAVPHIGTACIIGLVMLLYLYTGQAGFAGIKALAAGIPAGIRSLVFILSVVGFGLHAGIIPFHSQAVRVHSAAPSNISALMSGVMTKTGIYGILRISLDLAGQGPQWWGIAVILIGAVTSAGGILYALRERDLKRLLASAGISSGGIILISVGSSMLSLSNALYSFAAAALTAGMYHSLNHSLFNGLLFLSTGSVEYARNTRKAGTMSGLLKTMPQTGSLFLIGLLSLCTLPPFGSFVSSWLTYQALFLGFQTSTLMTKIASLLGIAALALSSALAVSVSAKAFRASLPKEVDRGHAAALKKSSFPMSAGMAVPALLCVIGGLFPDSVIALFSSSVFILTGSTGILGSGGAISVSQTGASLFPVAIQSALMISVTVAAAAGFLIAKVMKRTIQGQGTEQ